TAAKALRSHRQATSSSRAQSEFALVAVALLRPTDLRLGALSSACRGSVRRWRRTWAAGRRPSLKARFAAPFALWLQNPRKHLETYLRESVEAAALQWCQQPRTSSCIATQVCCLAQPPLLVPPFPTASALEYGVLARTPGQPTPARLDFVLRLPP